MSDWECICQIEVVLGGSRPSSLTCSGVDNSTAFLSMSVIDLSSICSSVSWNPCEGTHRLFPLNWIETLLFCRFFISKANLPPRDRKPLFRLAHAYHEDLSKITSGRRVWPPHLQHEPGWSRNDAQQALSPWRVIDSILVEIIAGIHDIICQSILAIVLRLLCIYLFVGY